MASDNSDNQEDFESQTPRKRKPQTDDADVLESAQAPPIEPAEEEPLQDTKKPRVEIRPPAAATQQRREEKDLGAFLMYAKTQNVKDLCNVLTGCCSVPGIEHIKMAFAAEGMQLYAKPEGSPSIVTAFLSNTTFSEYNIKHAIDYTISKAELDDLKKRVAKDVEFLEIRATEEGVTIGGQRTYKCGGECTFEINLTSIEVVPAIEILDMSNVQWNWEIRTASQHFADNVAFFDDQIEFIQMAIRQERLEFEGVRDTGTRSKSINQPLEGPSFDGVYKALFQKPFLKVVTSAKDISKSLTIKFRMDKGNFPVHFMYELDHAKPMSHFSVYVGPSSTQQRR